MSDDESEGEVPVCGSFEPQVWRKGYCRNCFHPGNKHLSENILKIDDNKKLGKENIPKKTDKSSKDAPPADKTKPFKRTGQDSLKSAADKVSGLKTDKLLDKDKPLSAKDKYAKLQQDKAQSKDSSSPPKTGVEKFKDGKKTIPDKKDSTNTIPPPVLPKTKGKGLAADDKFKSKSTSDIREAIKSPVGNKLFKPPGQNDALDKPKSKFGSAENISSSAKKLDESSKNKSGSAENISSDKNKQAQKVNKDSEKKESPTNNASKPDYRSLLASKDSKSDSGKTTSDKYASISKKDNKLKDKTPTQQPESKFKLGKDSKLLTKEKTEAAKVDDPTGDASKKGFPFKLGLKSKTENTDLKSPLNEKDKPDYKAKFEKPELKSSSKTEEKDKKDFKSKYEKPELKALKLGDKHKEDENSKTKLIDIEKKSDNYLKFKKDDSASRKTDEADKGTLGKLKLKPSANSESKDKQSPASLKDDRSPKDEKYKLVDLKAGLKTASKTDDKDKIKINTPDKDIKPKFEKPELKSAKSDDKGLSVLAKTLEKDKNKPLEDKEKSKPKFGHLEKDKIKDLKTDDSKQKYEKPALKSVKDDEKGKVSSKKEDDSKSGKTDLKSVLNKDNKFDFKTSVDNKKSKSLNNSEVETVDEKAKLSRPGLKSSKVDDTSKKDFKAKFERPQLKPTKSDEPKSDDKSAQIKDDFSSHKREENVPLNKPSDPSKDKETKSKDVPKIYNDIKKASKTECQDDKSPIKPKEREPLSTSTTTRLDETAALKQETQVNGENLLSDTEAINSFSSDSNPQHLVNLSSDAETDLDEPDNACAVISAHNDSPVHVDTQVFTSSRRKTAGVDSENSDLFTTTPQKGFSGSQVLKSVSPSREKSEEKESIKNGHISEDVKEKSNENTEQKTVAIVDIGDDIEKLKLELSKMAEKCQELEGENDSLRHGLSAKESDHSDLEKQKHEVESLILDLKDQLKSMEDRCVKLESDNSNLMTSLKEQEEVTEHQASTEDADNIHDDIKESEDVCETLMEENEDLKQEILDLKVEMEEMYDSFRDQEAEEFRELQKELEITAKNCRILQFKMRKAERRNEQLEDDRNLFQDKLRILQNQFENKDAVSHIKTLEEELKVNIHNSPFPIPNPSCKCVARTLICLFDLILYVPLTIFQLNRDGSYWDEPVLSLNKCVLLKDHNAVTPVRLEPAATRSRVKHATTKPLPSLQNAENVTHIKGT